MKLNTSNDTEGYPPANHRPIEIPRGNTSRTFASRFRLNTFRDAYVLT